MDMYLDVMFMEWVEETTSERPKRVTRLGSNEANAVYRLEFETRSLILKTGPDLDREYLRLGRLESRLPAPQPIAFTTHGDVDAILMSVIAGRDLSALKAMLPPATIIARLADSLKRVHACDIADWPFGGAGSVLVHGDACLPNFLYDGNEFSGCLDVGDLAPGDPDIDLSAAVWSLQYNLGPGYGRAFLEQYGVGDVSDEYVEELRLRYEEG